ncbi:tyrosine-type recombinase/integrase [Flagellimonas baculiformis]|uniref:tyrosine-type recombinase/integrase n=1 Tax=Flagellimonas baculiformis TaxID=3067310 RepID=UPI00296F8293|nr:tyrosine-type recombinase/integrase [Muricauda sp. D6]
MTTSLKLDKKSKNEIGEYPLYIRIRGRNSNGKYSESSIYSGVDLSEKHFKKGGLSPRTPNYTDKQRIINGILDDLQRIISESIEDGFEPNPKFIKREFEERKKFRELKTPQIQSFWKSFDEYIETKKNTSYGYRKTITTLVNHLKEFEEYIGRKISFEYVVLKTILFQSEFNDYMWNQKNISNSYLNKLYDNLSGFLYFSHQMGYINRKPRLKLESTIEKDEKVYLRTEEVIKLFNSKKWDYDETKEQELLKNPHIIIIEEPLKGTRSKEFGGVLKVTNWELVKYIFLFQNSIGCRIGDIPHFKLSNMDFDPKTQIFSWVQQKTNKKVSVPLNDIGGFIFRKFSSGKSKTQTLFPKISQQKFNKQLKYLLKDLGFNRMITKPKMIGSKVVDTEEKPLWELISSHGGRRGFVKNSIDLGNMDYQTIMKLSGHKTFSEFSKYISVTTTDTLKIRGLYKSDKKTQEDKLEQFKKEFSKLSEENKDVILGVMRSFNNSY